MNSVGDRHQLAHLPFIEEMATLTESDPEAPAIHAGLLIARFADRWMEYRSPAANLDSRAARSVRAVIAQIPTGAEVHSILASLLESMLVAGAHAARSVSQQLMDYGRALDLDARWKLAVDVYDTVLHHTDFEEDSETVINAFLRRGSCLRDLGRLPEAEASYILATDHARRAGSMRGSLRAQIGRAKIAYARGNLPLADAILNETIRIANIHSLAEVRSLASHDRAQIAHARCDYDAAIRYDYAAFRESTSDSERERILNDLAAAFSALGLRSAAQDVLLVLAATAREQMQRWTSTINLMEFAAEDGSRLQFEQYRQQLVAAELPPRLRVEFDLHVGRGYDLLAEPELARPWLERALHNAIAHSLNRLVFAAEAALEANMGLQNTRIASARKSIAVDVMRIADELRAMREHALSGSSRRT